MKVAFFAFLLVAVGVSAFPQEYVGEIERMERNIVTDVIRNAINQVRVAIIDAGLDPLEVIRVEVTEEIIPWLVVFEGFIDSLRFTGLSNIVINQLSYGILTNRLQITVSLPQLLLTVGEAGMTANVFGATYSGQLKGTGSINDIRVIGDIRVNIGIISGITIRSLAMNFRLDSITSEFTVIGQETDYSDSVNTFLSTTIPDFLLTNRSQIDQILTDVVRAIADSILSSNVVAQESMVMQLHNTVS